MPRASFGNRGRARPEQIITPDEVHKWLADSVVKTITYHRTLPSAARDIVEHGVDPERSKTGAYGQGFYTATVSDEFLGPAEVAVAIWTRHPLIGSLDEVGNVFDDLRPLLRPRVSGLTTEVAAAIRPDHGIRPWYDR